MFFLHRGKYYCCSIINENIEALETVPGKEWQIFMTNGTFILFIPREIGDSIYFHKLA